MTKTEVIDILVLLVTRLERVHDRLSDDTNRHSRTSFGWVMLDANNNVKKINLSVGSTEIESAIDHEPRRVNMVIGFEPVPVKVTFYNAVSLVRPPLCAFDQLGPSPLNMGGPPPPRKTVGRTMPRCPWYEKKPLP